MDKADRELLVRARAIIRLAAEDIDNPTAKRVLNRWIEDAQRRLT